MSTATVTVAYVNPPAPGKKQASIKDAQGNRYGYDPGQFNFIKGATYEITYESRDYQGKTYHTIKSSKGGSVPAGTMGSVVPLDRWWMPFVSNTVAHAIAAGQITVPSQIEEWAVAAKAAAVNLERVKGPEGEDDDIPY